MNGRPWTVQAIPYQTSVGPRPAPDLDRVGLAAAGGELGDLVAVVPRAAVADERAAAVVDLQVEVELKVVEAIWIEPTSITVARLSQASATLTCGLKKKQRDAAPARRTSSRRSAPMSLDRSVPTSQPRRVAGGVPRAPALRDRARLERVDGAGAVRGVDRGAPVASTTCCRVTFLLAAGEQDRPAALRPRLQRRVRLLDQRGARRRLPGRPCSCRSS